MRDGRGVRTLRRGRLDAQLDRIFDFQAGEVTGPAGSGKTTWLKSWATTTTCADVAWLTVEKRHRDELVLARALLCAVHGIPEQAEVGGIQMANFVDHLGRAIEGTGRRMVVVIDEAEALAGAEACSVLRDLIVSSDDRYRVLIAGRAAPDACLEPLRRRGELLFFTAADLRLTRPETAELVRLVTRSEPRESELAAIHRQVDGWALGVVLAGLVIDHVGDSALARAEGLDGHRYFDQFFGSEVFSALPDDIQAFLLDTSALPQLEPDLCAEIAGRDDALTVLRGLEHDNVFVEWVGGQPPVFRYHALLRSWLRANLKRLDPRRPAELARRAASWFRARGRFAEAIECLLAAGDVDAAAALIVDYGPSALGEGRYEAMRTWIGALPRQLLSSNGPLLILLAEAEHRTGDAAAATATRALARGLSAGDSGVPPLDHFELTVAVQRGTELHRAGWLETAADQGRHALSTVALGPLSLAGERVRFPDLLLAMDVASVASQLLFVDRLAESAELSRWVVDNYPVDDRTVATVRVRCLGQAAVAALLQGARSKAAGLATEALAICRLHDLDPVDVGYAELVLVVVGPEADRPALDATLRRRVALIDLPSHTCLVGLLRAWSYVRSGDLAAAREALDEADQQLSRIHEPGMLTSLRSRVRAMVDAGADEPPLSERDRQVLAVLAASSSRRTAAERLHLSLNTVKTYARRIYRTLGVSTLADAIATCEALGVELSVPDYVDVEAGEPPVRQRKETAR